MTAARKHWNSQGGEEGRNAMEGDSLVPAGFVHPRRGHQHLLVAIRDLDDSSSAV
jgi:hypothetical protein